MYAWTSPPAAFFNAAFLASGLSRAYKIDKFQKVGEAQENPKERVATSFDVEQHLERARNARGKKKTVVEPNKTELRKDGKATDRLVIADTGLKVYRKGVAVLSVRKKYEKKDYSMFNRIPGNHSLGNEFLDIPIFPARVASICCTT